MSERDAAGAGFRSGVVTVVGRPNVGKSTLVNLLVGHKVSIVADVAQTTRNRIRGILSLPEGQLVLVDTPGIHRPQHEMNRRMVEGAIRTMDDVDLILFMIEAAPPARGRPGGGSAIGPGDRFILSRLPAGGPPVVLLINKIDRIRREALLPLIASLKDLHPFREIVPLSALSGDNTAALPRLLLGLLPEGPALFPEEYATDQHERFLAAEIVREKILHHSRQEIPHETCVLIDSFEDTADGLRRIEATILVERESQRRILIGHEGSFLKQVGTEARLELERLFDRKVFLSLWVRARPGWREEEDVLERLGLRD